MAWSKKKLQQFGKECFDFVKDDDDCLHISYLEIAAWREGKWPIEIGGIVKLAENSHFRPFYDAIQAVIGNRWLTNGAWKRMNGKLAEINSLKYFPDLMNHWKDMKKAENDKSSEELQVLIDMVMDKTRSPVKKTKIEKLVI